MKLILKLILRIVPVVALRSCSGRPESARDTVSEDPGVLEGYLDQVSYDPGDTLTMRVHTLQPAFSYAITRLGLAEVTLLVKEGLPGTMQTLQHDACTEGLPEWKGRRLRQILAVKGRSCHRPKRD